MEWKLSNEEKVDYLIGRLKEDSVLYQEIEVGKDAVQKRRLLRALMNVRMPGPLDECIWNVQDELLQEETKEKGIVYLTEIPTIKEQYESKHAYAEKLSLWQGDITRLSVDAIVNAANSQMLGCFVPCHKCIDNAIHSAAGMELREECNQKMQHKRLQYGQRYEEPTGQALLTKGYNLPAKYVIHTVGPIVYGELNDSLRQDLADCYLSVLRCALEHGIRSIAFCCISTGEFHFPNEEAAEIAVRTVSRFLEQNEDAFDRILFNVFKEIDFKLYQRIFTK